MNGEDLGAGALACSDMQAMARYSLAAAVALTSFSAGHGAHAQSGPSRARFEEGRVLWDAGRPVGDIDGPIPLDPGDHRIHVQARGYDSADRTLTVIGEAERLELRIELVANDDEGPVSSVEDSGSGGFAIAGYTLGGVGLAGLVLGGVFAGLATSARDQAREGGCDDGDGFFECDAAGLDEIDRATTWATASTIGFIAGGVLTATGVALVVVDLSASGSAEEAAQIELRLSPTALAVGGRF